MLGNSVKEHWKKTSHRARLHVRALNHVENLGFVDAAEQFGAMGEWTPTPDGEPVEHIGMSGLGKGLVYSIMGLLAFGSAVKTFAQSTHDVPGDDSSMPVGGPTLSQAQHDAFPIVPHNYTLPDSAHFTNLRLDALISNLSNPQVANNDVTDSVLTTVFSASNPDATQRYAVNLVPDSSGVYGLTHTDNNNRTVTLAGAANLLQIPEDKILDFIRMNLEGAAPDSTIGYTQDGAYKDIKVNARHVRVNKGDVVKFTPEMVSPDVRALLKQYNDAISNSNTSKVNTTVSTLRDLNTPMSSLITAISEHDSLSYDDFKSMRKTLNTIDSSFQASRSSINLTDSVATEVDSTYNTFNDAMTAFLDEINKATTPADASSTQEDAFPVNLADYNLPDTNAVGQLRFAAAVDGLEANLIQSRVAKAKIVAAESALTTVFSASNPDATQRYAVNLVPDSSGVYGLTHTDNNNRTVTLAGAANLLGIPEDKIPDFINMNVNEAVNPANISVLQDGDYTDLQHNGSHIRVNKGDVVKFTLDIVGSNVKPLLENYDETSVGTENTVPVDSNTINLLTNLNNSMIAATDSLKSSLANDGLSLNEFIGLWAGYHTIDTLFKTNIDSLKLSANDRKTVNKTYRDFQDTMFDFFDSVNGTLPGEIKGYHKRESWVMKSLGSAWNYVKGFTGLKANAGATVIAKESPSATPYGFATVGLGLKNNHGTSVNVGFLYHDSEHGYDSEPVTIPFSGGEQFGTKHNDISSLTPHLGVDVSLEQEITRHISAGVKSIFIPFERVVEVSGEEGIRYFDGPNGAPGTILSDSFSGNIKTTNNYNGVGAFASFRLPVMGVDATATPGVLWNVESGGTMYMLNVSFTHQFSGN